MKSRLSVFTLLALLALSAMPMAQARQTAPPAAAAGATVNITVRYTGKGVVDATHAVLVFMFDHAAIGAASRPIAPPQIVTKNGAVVTFNSVPASPVYFAAVYNQTGTYDGRNGPPAAGTPFAVYGKGNKAPGTPVTPGPKAAIKLTFSDATKWGQ